MSTLSNDYLVYMQHRNRADLLRNAVNSIREFWPLITIVDNSPEGLKGEWPGTIWRPPSSLTFTQTHNWFFQDAKERGARFIVWMHSDAVVAGDSHLMLVEFTRKCIADGRKFHTIWTNYDSLATVDLDSIDEVGGYDPCIRKYMADCDLHYRMRVAGYECIQSDITNIVHLGSQTIKSDPKLRCVNDVVHGLDRQYYIAKWGGDIGKETFKVPFNRPHWFKDLKPTGVW
jgi:hypothetical protein